MSRPAVRGVLDLAAFAAKRGWVRATSGNFSVRVDADTFAISGSGADKTDLHEADVGIMGLDGSPPGVPFRASAEVHLHAALYALPSVGAVAHTHSVAATVLSRRYEGDGGLTVEGLEMVKALVGHETHESTLKVPIVPNDQDTVRLARVVTPRLVPGVPAYLVAGHGLTVWGEDVASTRRHLDALEFLLECRLWEEARLPGGPRG